jgi:hypothetical protein
MTLCVVKDDGNKSESNKHIPQKKSSIMLNQQLHKRKSSFMNYDPKLTSKKQNSHLIITKFKENKK